MAAMQFSNLTCFRVLDRRRTSTVGSKRVSMSWKEKLPSLSMVIGG